MILIEWVNSHGIAVLVTYLMFSAIVGAMPPLPDNAGFWARWGYGALHGLSMNFKQALAMLKIQVPNGAAEKKDESK